MSGILTPAGCCCTPPAGDPSCANCKVDCNNLGTIKASAERYVSCDGAIYCDSAADGFNGILVHDATALLCSWATYNSGGQKAGDWHVSIDCAGGVAKKWRMAVTYDLGASDLCYGSKFISPVCVDGRPTGAFLIDLTDKEAFSPYTTFPCGSVLIVLSV